MYRSPYIYTVYITTTTKHSPSLNRIVDGGWKRKYHKASDRFIRSSTHMGLVLCKCKMPNANAATNTSHASWSRSRQNFTASDSDSGQIYLLRFRLRSPATSHVWPVWAMPLKNDPLLPPSHKGRYPLKELACDTIASEFTQQPQVRDITESLLEMVYNIDGISAL